MAQLSWNHFPLTTWYFRRRSKLGTGWVSKSQIWDGCTTLNLRSLHVICEWNVVFWCVLAQPKCRMCYYSSCNLLVPLRKGCDVCSMGWSSAHRGDPLPGCRLKCPRLCLLKVRHRNFLTVVGEKIPEPWGRKKVVSCDPWGRGTINT